MLSPLLLATATIVLSSGAFAELTGCTPLTCESNSNGVLTCPLGNSTHRAIGVAPLENTTSTPDKDLTWTVGVSSSVESLKRSFYYSQPKSSNSTAGCALLFTSIADSIAFPAKQPRPEADSGSCADALTDRCVDALLAGVTARLKDSSDCEKLVEEIKDRAPQECEFARSRKWGEIIAINLEDARKVEQEKCHPAGNDKNLAFVADVEKPNTGDAKEAQAFARGVTPVVTVIDGERVGLTCLKPVDRLTGSQNETEVSVSSLANEVKVVRWSVGMVLAAVMVAGLT